jgi:hypothetical protein
MDFPQSAWLIRAGYRGELIKAFEQKQAVALDIPDCGDPTSVSSAEEIQARLAEKVHDVSGEWTRIGSRQLLSFMRSIRVGDYVLVDDKHAQQILVGRVTGNFEYNRDIFGLDCPYIRRVAWSGRLARSQCTPEAQRDLYSVSAISDQRRHLAQIDALLGGQEFVENSGMDTLVRGEAIVGESFQLTRPEPNRFVLKKARGFYWVKALAWVMGLLVAVALPFAGPRIWLGDSAPLFCIGAVLALYVLQDVARHWNGLTVAAQGVEVVFDIASQMVTVAGRSVASFSDVSHVEIRSRTYEHSGPEGGPVTDYTYEHQLVLVFNQGNELKLATQESLYELLQAARPLAFLLRTRIERVRD